MAPIMVLLIMLSTVHGGSINVDHGRMVIRDNRQCNVSINNNDKILIDIENGEYIHNGVVFGLVSWWCDFEYGTIIKNIECKDCGIYCSYNQQFEICKTNGPLIIGIVLGVITFVLVLLTIIAFCKSKFNTLFTL